MKIKDLKKSEWSTEYETLRRNRMVMGAFRYGELKKQDLGVYDLIRECRRRIKRYEEDLNLEHLVDAGNMLMLEFVKGKREGLKLEPIDDGAHTPEKR